MTEKEKKIFMDCRCTMCTMDVRCNGCGTCMYCQDAHGCESCKEAEEEFNEIVGRLIIKTAARNRSEG